MIIVSQDKKMIINFNLIQTVRICNKDKVGIGETHKTWTLEFEDIQGKCGCVGYYKTEERVKEVLREIAKKYENSMWKLGRSSISFENEFVYEMPKE